MTAGLSAAKANSILSVLRNTAYAGIATPFVQLHTGDPGAAGTANVAATSTRNAVTWNAPAGGSMTLASLGSWTGAAAESISHISIWTASSAGTFVESWPLTASVPIIVGSTFSLPTLTLSFSPIAA